jgi:hypothetical protein
MIRSIWAALFLFMIVLLIVPASAQNQRKYAPVGFCTDSSLGSAVGLSSFTGTACLNVSNSTLGSYAYGIICAYTSGVVYRDDGTAPTATPGTGGQAINAGQCITYSGNFGTIQFIQQASGAIVGVSIYQ